MNRFFPRILTLSLILVASTAAAAEREWTVHLGLRHSLLTPGGKMGTRIDGEESLTDLDALGLDDAGAGAVSVGAHFKRWRFFASGQKPSFEGSGVTSKDITSGGITIPEGTPVDTTMNIGIYSLMATYDVIDRTVDIGVGAGLLVLDFSVAYKPIEIDQTLKVGETMPMPVIALGLTTGVKRFAFQGTFGFAYFSKDGNKAAYATTDLAARFALVKTDTLAFQASLGYRYIPMDVEIDLETSEFKADISISGPYLGLRAEF